MTKGKSVSIKKITLSKVRWKNTKAILDKPITTTVLILSVLSFVVFGLSAYYYSAKPEQYIQAILSEAHGMIFDLAIIGILLFWLNERSAKRAIIQRSEDDIDDIRYWKSEEATYKLKGHIKRLMNNGVHKMELYNCYLKNVNLNHANLSFSNLNYADLSHSNLIKTDFENARMNQTNFFKSNVNTTNFTLAMLTGANFEEAKGVKTDFQKAKLIKANFKSSCFIEANFSHSELSDVDFENASLYTPDFRHAVGISPEIFNNIKVLSSPKFDEEVELQIRKAHPHLFKSGSGNSQPPGAEGEIPVVGMPGERR